MDALFQNVRFAVRSLIRARAFTATVVLLLAIGIHAKLIDHQIPPDLGASGGGGCTSWTTYEYSPDCGCYETCTKHICTSGSPSFSRTQSSSQRE